MRCGCRLIVIGRSRRRIQPNASYGGLHHELGQTLVVDKIGGGLLHVLGQNLVVAQMGIGRGGCVVNQKTLPHAEKKEQNE